MQRWDLTSTGLGSPDLWLLWMHRFTCSAGKLLFISWILPNNLCCQAAFEVCLLKPWRVEQEKSFDCLSHKRKKAHLVEKLRWSCLGVQHDKHSIQQDTQQHWLAHQHRGCADLFLQGQNNCTSSCKQALLNCSEHTFTRETADAPNLAGLAYCDPHTRFVRPGQEGQALKSLHKPLVVRTTARSFRKQAPESMRKTRNQEAEEKQRLIKNRALQILEFKPWKRSRSNPSQSLSILSLQCRTPLEHPLTEQPPGRRAGGCWHLTLHTGQTFRALLLF